MARDSKVWEEALIASRKVPTQHNKQKAYVVKRNEIKEAKRKAEFTFQTEDRVLHTRLRELNKQILILKIEQQAVVKTIKERKALKRADNLQTVKLYALKLQDDCWYIGMSFNPDKRYLKHCKGKGAQFTKLHRPIEIFEVRDTGLYTQDEVALLEDDMTLQYARQYGVDKVRGGGYCQSKPHWPKDLSEPDMSWVV